MLCVDGFVFLFFLSNMHCSVARMRDELGTQIMGDFKEAMEAYIKGGKVRL